jgi:hypothetical protein
MRSTRGPRLGGALVVFALALSGCGGGEDATSTATTSPEGSAPSDVVAVVEGVENGAITRDELDAAVTANAELSGQPPPAPGAPAYGLVAGEALDQLVLERWVEGEAADRGVSPESLADEPVADLQGTWGPRTECVDDVVSRLCGGGEEPAEPPPDIPPASGLEEPPGG